MTVEEINTTAGDVARTTTVVVGAQAMTDTNTAHRETVAGGHPAMTGTIRGHEVVHATGQGRDQETGQGLVRGQGHGKGLGHASGLVRDLRKCLAPLLQDLLTGLMKPMDTSMCLSECCITNRRAWWHSTAVCQLFWNWNKRMMS